MGSFRNKQEIDSAIEEFTGLGVKVLAPEKGRLHESPWEGFFPTSHEIGLPPGLIEDGFLNNIRSASFVYLMNPISYIGNTVSMELGFSIALGKRIYAKEKLEPLTLDNDLRWLEINKCLEFLSYKEIVEKELEQARILEGQRSQLKERGFG